MIFHSYVNVYQRVCLSIQPGMMIPNHARQIFHPTPLYRPWRSSAEIPVCAMPVLGREDSNGFILHSSRLIHSRFCPVSSITFILMYIFCSWVPTQKVNVMSWAGSAALNQMRCKWDASDLHHEATLRTSCSSAAAFHVAMPGGILEIYLSPSSWCKNSQNLSWCNRWRRA